MNTYIISKLLLIQEIAEQSNNSLQPILCSKANRINERYYLEFTWSQRMITNIDLNPAAGKDDIVKKFLVYKLNSFLSIDWVSNGIFGHDDVGFDKMLGYPHYRDLTIASTINDNILIGCNRGNYKKAIAS